MIVVEEDFYIPIQTLEFHSDENKIDVNITIRNDESVESNETFVISLTSDAEVNFFPYSWTKVIIYDDDTQNNDMDSGSDEEGMTQYWLYTMLHITGYSSSYPI